MSLVVGSSVLIVIEEASDVGALEDGVSVGRLGGSVGNDIGLGADGLNSSGSGGHIGHLALTHLHDLSKGSAIDGSDESSNLVSVDRYAVAHEELLNLSSSRLSLAAKSEEGVSANDSHYCGLVVCFVVGLVFITIIL